MLEDLKLRGASGPQRAPRCPPPPSFSAAAV